MRVTRLVAIALVCQSIAACSSTTPTIAVAPTGGAAPTRDTPTEQVASATPPAATSAAPPTGFPLPTSAPSTTWRRFAVGEITHPRAVSEWDDSIWAVVPFGDQMIAVGRDTTGGSDFGFIATSPDGRTGWTREPDTEAVFRGAELGSLKTDGKIVLVLQSAWNSKGLPIVPHAWSSGDGRTWTPAPEAGNPAMAVGEHVWFSWFGPSPTGWLAIAVDDQGTASIAQSADGLTWGATTTMPGLFGDGVPRDIAPYRGGWVAVGGELEANRNANRTAPARAWWSADGLHWIRAPTDAGMPIREVIAGRSGLLGRGTVGDISGFGWSPPAEGWASAGGQVWGRAAMISPYAEIESDGVRIVRHDLDGSWAWSWNGVDWMPIEVPALPKALGPGQIVGWWLLPHGVVAETQTSRLIPGVDPERYGVQNDYGLWWLGARA